nr:zinc finger, CCHC-type [Tanacetum cinerariifolium]
MLPMKEDETIDNFTRKLTTLVNKAASLGHTIEDSVVVRKLLNVVPDKFLQIVASIEQYSDLDEMSVDKAIRRLNTFKERLKISRPITRDKSQVTCYRCHKLGHYVYECPNKRKNQVKEQSNLIEEDLEPTLFMATINEKIRYNESTTESAEIAESAKISKSIETIGNVGLIFTQGDLKKVSGEVAKYKVGAPAHVGLIAPVDVVVPPGNTGLDPSQTSLF